MSHKLVRCDRCDLVYVDTPPTKDDLADAYHLASYDSSREANDAALSYAKAIAPAVTALCDRRRALEIGTGSGIFLEYLIQMGFSDVVGIEPSIAAIQAAPLYRRKLIKRGVFVETDYPAQSFDLICCFMTLEHVHDPGTLARAAYRLLRDGGVFVTVTHDYRSWINRMLGAKSPIVDVEHMQLFSNQSIRALFVRAGFTSVHNQSFRNRYAIDYWLRLAPIPARFKRVFCALVELVRLSNKRVSVNVGNQLTVGFRRDSPTTHATDEGAVPETT